MNPFTFTLPNGESEGQVSGSKLLMWVFGFAIVAFFVVLGLNKFFESLGFDLWWTWPAVGLLVTTFFWKALADRFSGILETPVFRLIILSTLYGFIAYAMYEEIPALIQAQTGVSLWTAWQIALLAGIPLIPGIWKAYEPARLFPGTAKVVGWGYLLIAVGLIALLQWAQTDSWFSVKDGESTFWVGAEEECPYSTDGFSKLNAEPLRPGTPEDAARFRTDPQYAHCPRNLMNALSGNNSDASATSFISAAASAEPVSVRPGNYTWAVKPGLTYPPQCIKSARDWELHIMRDTGYNHIPLTVMVERSSGVVDPVDWPAHQREPVLGPKIACFWLKSTTEEVRGTFEVAAL